MKKILTAVLIGAAAAPVGAGSLQERAEASRKVAMEFMGQLKGELQAAMKSGGPVAAIEVCHTRAPQIAQSLSEQHGWTVARTSAKNRNPDNAPDSWESDVLAQFEARKAGGEHPQTLEFYAVVEEDGRKTFRYMKAIPTGEVCLTCHGEHIAPEVAEKIKTLYPLDKATGFRKGDLRGAFTFSQPM